MPAITGWATQGETMEELQPCLAEAIDGFLSVSIEEALASTEDKVIELAI